MANVKSDGIAVVNSSTCERVHYVRGSPRRDQVQMVKACSTYCHLFREGAI